MEPVLAVESFNLTVTEDFWQKKLVKLQPEIQSAINYGLKFASGVIKGLGDIFNKKLANEGPETFDIEIKDSLFLNLTMTKAPIFDSKADEIMIHVDSMFTSANMTQYVDTNTDW